MATELTTEQFAKLVETYGDVVATKALADETVLNDLLVHAKNELGVIIKEEE